MSNRNTILISIASAVVLLCSYFMFISPPKDNISPHATNIISERNRHPSPTPSHNKTTIKSTYETLGKLDESVSERLASDTVKDKDPEDVIKIINTFSDPRDALGLLAKFFPQIAEKDTDTAVRLAGMLQNPKAAKWARALIITTVANSNPVKALALANSIGRDSLGLHYENIFKKWVQSAPKDAMDYWSQMSASQEKDRAGHMLVDVWANQDPRGLLDFITANPNFSFKREAMTGAITQLGKGDITLALKYIKESNLGDFKIQLASTLIKSINSNTDITSIVAWVNEMPGGALKTQAIIDLVSTIGPTNSSISLNLLEGLSPGPPKDAAVNKFVADVFRKAGAEAALNLLSDMTDSGDREVAKNILFKEWSNKEPQQSIKYVLDKMNGDKGAMKVIISQWAVNNPAQAVDWVIQNLSAGKIAESQIPTDSIIGSLSAYSPQQAIEMAKNRPDLFPLNGKNVQVLAFNLTKVDPLSASDWVNALPASNDKDMAYRSVADAWMAFDSEKASKWVGSLANGSSKDSAIVSIVYGVVGHDPQLAFEWANSVSNKKLRDQLISSIPAMKK